MTSSNHFPVERRNGSVYPSLKEDVSAANAVLQLSTLTNGELNVRAYENMEKKTGLPLADLASREPRHEAQRTPTSRRSPAGTPRHPSGRV